MQITVTNRNSGAGRVARAFHHLVPKHLVVGGVMERPSIRRIDAHSLVASHPSLGKRWLEADIAPEWLFTENETNTDRLHKIANLTPYVKDGINEYVVNGQKDAVNPRQDRHQGSRAVQGRRQCRRVGGDSTSIVRCAAVRRLSASHGRRASAARIRRRHGSPASRSRGSSTRRSFRSRSTR
jgi:hypothetical protein